TQSHLGGANLGLIQAAADSLVAWAGEKVAIPDRRDLIEALNSQSGLTPGLPTAVETASDQPGPKKPKRSTEGGEGKETPTAALTNHHRSARGGCLNLESIGNNELAQAAGVSPSTASAFFRSQFKGHAKYRSQCRDPGSLAAALKLLNGEFAPH